MIIYKKIQFITNVLLGRPTHSRIFHQNCVKQNKQTYQIKQILGSQRPSKVLGWPEGPVMYLGATFGHPKDPEGASGSLKVDLSQRIKGHNFDKITCCATVR